MTNLLGTTLALTILGGVISSARAVRLADGTVYFTQPPFLVKATTTFKEVYMWGATYYFTLDVPSNAGEPLKRVTIAQNQGGYDIDFELKRTRAFEGGGESKKQFTISQVTMDKKTPAVSVTFDPPIPPGKTVTISLKPYQNPRFEGVYLFGVTAFPPGEKVHGQFLGFGRLTFYDGGRDSIR